MKHQGDKYYLYRHIRLDKNEPFYIGVGQKTNNYTSYEKEYRRAFDKIYNRTNYWKRIVDKTDYEVEILIESNDYDFILQKETEFIKLYGRKDLGMGTLVNLNDGGGGNKGYRYTEEQKLSLSRIKKDRWEKGLLTNFGKSKKVYQYDRSGKYLSEFDSVKDAEEYMNLANSSIARAARGETKTSGGFLWSYKKEDNIDIPERRKGVKKVLQFSINGEKIKEWNSVYDAALFYNVSNSNIINHLNGNSKSACGYKWSYSEKENNQEDETSK